MLRELRITNLALVRRLDTVFDEGLTVLTGETGAGKSIILQAIHLLAGGRADASWVRDGADSALVEALFEISPARSSLLNEIREMGFDVEGELVVKRILSAQGRSRFYLNGNMCTARDAGHVFQALLNVASQHDQQQLLLPRFHLDFIDLVGGLLEDRDSLGLVYDQWSGLRTRLRELEGAGSDRERRSEFLRHQLKEIDAAAVRPGEDAELVRERDRLKVADVLLQFGHRASRGLDEAVVSMAQIRKDIEQMAGHDKELAVFSGQVSGSAYQLEDHALEIRRYLAGIPNDSRRLEELSSRMSVLQGLKRKYGGDLDAVCLYADSIRQELEELDSLEERIAVVKKEIAACANNLAEAARSLSARRVEVAKELEGRIQSELADLCLQQAVFSISFGDISEDIGTISRSGWDRPEFMFSANPGEPVRPLVKIASGGELSRVMLALKCLLARKDQVETVVFDEVDAGISGKTAEAVARKIKELSGHHQVLCITHLPQIASRADCHFHVSKRTADQRTETEIAELAQESRVSELARMLDGDSVTASTLAYARELMSRNSASANTKQPF